MQLSSLNSALIDCLNIPAFEKIDSAFNGLQVDRANQTVQRVATAVDAAIATIERAAQWKADMLFVHHGIFWGAVRPITANHRARIKLLLDHDIALYAVHLPLDAHPQMGNNIAIVEKLRLANIVPFGMYHGAPIGYQGSLPQTQTVDEIRATLQAEQTDALGTLPFGKTDCTTVAIVSGGGNFTLAEAITAHVDLLITGDAQYASYYEAQENNINVLFAGHYNTEVFGVQRVGNYLQTTHGLETQFIDLPTGL